MEKLRIKYPCIVEGKYDKIKLGSVIEGKIIPTNGFGIFSDKEKRRMFIAFSEKTPLIIATDSDGAGLVIRNHFRSIIPENRLFHVYIPTVKGKEKRKTEYSKAGTLGLEGMEAQVLRELFAPFSEDNGDNDKKAAKKEMTKTDLYLMGLNGTEGSAERRRAILKMLSLPEELSTAAFLDVVNMLYDREYIMELTKSI